MRSSDLRRVLSYPRELALAFFVIVFSTCIPSFGQADNLRNLLVQMSPLLLLAIGQSFVLLLGAIDLTQGAMLGLASVAMVVLFGSLGPPAGILLTVVGAMLVGAGLGFVIARTRVDALVASMAVMFVLGGATMYWTGGTPVTSADPESGAFLSWLGTKCIGPVPVLFMAAVLLAIGAHIFLRHFMLGLRIYAVGSNRRAAVALGIKAEVIYALAYALSAAFTVASALLLTARIRQGNPHLGEGLLFESIGGAVLGGVALTGGVGSVWAVVRGVAMLALIQNALYLTDLNSYIRDIVVGLLILAGIILSQRGKRGGRQ